MNMVEEKGKNIVGGEWDEDGGGEGMKIVGGKWVEYGLRRMG